MTTTTRNQGSAPPLKGSWEALCDEAGQLSLHGNDAAIAKFNRLVERLTGMPQARLQAHDNRLQRVLEQSVIGLQSHYAGRNRLDEAAHAGEEALDLLSGDARSLWRENRARVYLWQERHEEAAHIMRGEVEALKFDVEIRWLLFSILIDGGKLEEAEAVRSSLIDALGSLFIARNEHGFDPADEDFQLRIKERMESSGDSDKISVQFGLIHFLRCCLALERGHWREALDAFVSASKLSDAYANRWHLLYRPLVVNRQPRFAQRALNREQSPISQGFWRGLSGYYAGDKQGAEVEWRRVAQNDLDNVTLASVGDWILAHYYLDRMGSSARSEEEGPQSGEPPPPAETPPGGSGLLSADGRKGLQAALSLLRQQDTRRDPLALGLAALGWGMNGYKDHLHRNLRHSLELLRGAFNDNKLSVYNWYFFRDLLQPDDFAAVEQSFHRPKRPA